MNHETHQMACQVLSLFFVQNLVKGQNSCGFQDGEVKHVAHCMRRVGRNAEDGVPGGRPASRFSAEQLYWGFGVFGFAEEGVPLFCDFSAGHLGNWKSLGSGFSKLTFV